MPGRRNRVIWGKVVSKRNKDNAPHHLFTVRKDGFMYLASKGDWARFMSKPMVLKEPKLTINAQATIR